MRDQYISPKIDLAPCCDTESFSLLAFYTHQRAVRRVDGVALPYVMLLRDGRAAGYRWRKIFRV